LDPASTREAAGDAAVLKGASITLETDFGIRSFP
jgi:hypothetical protein